ncbi:hypothetical protein PsYK624_122620 [Phanerochaete sordida]|uniref:Uncharacterized protein n=1 Tax=Phanerochaete sordida TaxID=48140 RepID=A0A9P3LIV8_9APHY|nr:hypothetical protein PsYK624_122620 [Phanerochaete sordida]
MSKCCPGYFRWASSPLQNPEFVQPADIDVSTYQHISGQRLSWQPRQYILSPSSSADSPLMANDEPPRKTRRVNKKCARNMKRSDCWHQGGCTCHPLPPGFVPQSASAVPPALVTAASSAAPATSATGPAGSAASEATSEAAGPESRRSAGLGLSGSDAPSVAEQQVRSSQEEHQGVPLGSRGQLHSSTSAPAALSSTQQPTARSQADAMVGNPNYASHIAPIFTASRAETIQQRADQRAVDAQLLARKAEKTRFVWIHVLLKDEGEAVIHRWTHPFSPWPFVVFSREVLVELGLCSDLGAHGTFSFFAFNDSLNTWVRTKEGSSMEVATGQKVYLRALDCPRPAVFPPISASSSPRVLGTSAASPHLRFNLAGERASVRQQRHDALLSPNALPSASPSFTPLGLASTSTSSQPTVPSQSPRPSDHPQPRAQPSFVFQPQICPAPRPPPASSPSPAPAPASSPSSPTSTQQDPPSPVASTSRPPPTLHRKEPDDIIIITDSSDDDLPSIQAIIAEHKKKRQVKIEDHSETPDLTVPASSSSPPAWPSQYHAVDINNLFLAAAREGRAGAVFAAHFPGVPFAPATFYSHRERWLKGDGATEDLRSRFVNYGRTDQGLWQRFMDIVPDPRAALRNVGKKNKRASSKEEA